jgi:hypothetical protein
VVSLDAVSSAARQVGGVSFPLPIMALVPLRRYLLPRLFKPAHLAQLDAAEYEAAPPVDPTHPDNLVSWWGALVEADTFVCMVLCPGSAAASVIRLVVTQHTAVSRHICMCLCHASADWSMVCSISADARGLHQSG